MDQSKTNSQLIMASGNATIRHLYARTATFVDTNDRLYGPNAQWEIFSGTFVRIQNRLFVATVSHSLDNFENPSRYVLTTKNGHPHPSGRAIILRTFATNHDYPDVGLIELDADMFRAFDEFEAIDLDRISVASPERQLASLMGSPSITVKVHPIDDGTWGISGTISGFTTAAVAASEWPRLNLRRQLDKEIDLLVRYPIDSTNIRDETGGHSKLPQPFGVSGGGLWIHDDCKNDIWLPDNCQLVGIQSSWLADAQYVRLTRVSYWLDLVYSHYTDLRDAIDKINGYSFGGSELPKMTNK